MAKSARTSSPATGNTRSPRRAGRPTGVGPELRPRLLDAALACFARTGIAATSLRAIAAEAQVTPALLHYYFGDKDQLLQAVIDERLLPVFGAIRASILGGDDDVAALVAAFVRGMTAAIEQHPWLPPLWVREVVCEGGALRGPLFNSLLPQLPQMLAQRFAQAQREGRLNPDLDPRLLVTSLVGLTLFPAAGAPVWQMLFAADDIDAQAMRRHAMALLGRGLEAG